MLAQLLCAREYGASLDSPWIKKRLCCHMSLRGTGSSHLLASIVQNNAFLLEGVNRLTGKPDLTGHAAGTVASALTIAMLGAESATSQECHR